MNKDFFNENEDLGFALIKDLNNVLNINNLEKTPMYCFCDASGTSKNKVICIEIKIRNAILTNDGTLSSATFQSDEIMIEAHKLASLLFSALYDDTEPLYVNFLQDGTAIVFNLKKLHEMPKKKLFKKILSMGYQREEATDRFLLNIKDAWIYRKENAKWKMLK